MQVHTLDMQWSLFVLMLSRDIKKCLASMSFSIPVLTSMARNFLMKQKKQESPSKHMFQSTHLHFVVLYRRSDCPRISILSVLPIQNTLHALKISGIGSISGDIFIKRITRRSIALDVSLKKKTQSLLVADARSTQTVNSSLLKKKTIFSNFQHFKSPFLISTLPDLTS